VQVNTIYTPNVSVKVYINGSLAETKTGNGPPNYNKFGAYASASGTGPCTTTWDSIQFWKQGQTGGYYITDVAGVNGTISPTTGFVGPLAAGASTTVTFAPSSGYTSNVYIDNVLTATGTTSYTFTNIQSSHMIYVTFTKGTPPPTFTITATAGTGGTITPAGAITVAAGSNQGFAIAANSGYTISAVTVDGTNQGAISSYTFSNVPANHTIAATFTQSAPPPTFTITATAGTGGTINPSGAISVASGGTQGFAIAANSGYTISAVTVDGTNEGAISSYTFSNVQANHTIAATFSQQTGNGPAAPAFSQPGGTYSGEVHVRVTDTTSGVSLYYTTDGSTPTASSTPVPDHTIEFKSTTTLKAIAILNGASSTVTSATYTID
jgi:hypothetical protein